MDCIVNVFITDDRIIPVGDTHSLYKRGALPASNQLDTFKYMIASMRPLIPLFNRIYICCELAESYKSRQEEIDNYINETFNGQAIYRTKRNYIQKDWIEFLTPIIDTEEHYFITCNHDHIFIDSSLEIIQGVVGEFICNTSHHKCIYPTHWPEVIHEAVLYRRNEPPSHYYSSHYVRSAGDGTLFVNREVLKYWFFRMDYGDKPMPRPDYHAAVEPAPNTIVFAPLKELFRHFDGYGHSFESIGIVPALHIPTGFFEKAMDIYYGFDDGIDGVQIHPGRHTKDVVATGVDMNCLLSDLPMFWKEHIRSINRCPYINDKLFVEVRNQVYLNALIIQAQIRRGDIVPMSYTRFLRKEKDVQQSYYHY